MLCEILEEIGLIVLELKFMKKLNRGRRGIPRHIWRSIVFKNSSNFEVNLLSALGKEFDEIDVLRNTRSSLHYTRRFKKLGQYRTHKQ